MQLDWQNIDTVLLDMDGTLLDLHFDNHFWQDHVPAVWAEQNGYSKDEALERLTPLFKQHAGTLNWYCVDFWSDLLKIDIMQHKAAVADKIAFRPKAQEFLQHCRRQSDDVRLVTNAHRKVLNYKIQFTQLDQYFDQMLCSHELAYPKEDQQFWHRLNQHAEFDPRRTLFLDDSEAVLEAADKYGIEHVYSIAQPDSKQDRGVSSRFPMVDEFQVS